MDQCRDRERRFLTRVIVTPYIFRVQTLDQGRCTHVRPTGGSTQRGVHPRMHTSDQGTCRGAEGAIRGVHVRVYSPGGPGGQRYLYIPWPRVCSLNICFPGWRQTKCGIFLCYCKRRRTRLSSASAKKLWTLACQQARCATLHTVASCLLMDSSKKHA
jgi:hypothetical protein